MTQVFGNSADAPGVQGDSTNSYGVLGRSTGAVGVVGDTTSQFTAVWGHNRGSGIGVLGSSSGDVAVLGETTTSQWPAVLGRNRGNGVGVRGESRYQHGVEGSSDLSHGVSGNSHSGFGVWGNSTNSHGVFGSGSVAYSGVFGNTVGGRGIGVWGSSGSGVGVFCTSRTGRESAGPGVALWCQNRSTVGKGKAGVFEGSVDVIGNLTVVNGNKPFKIDHPLDPQHKYLLHNAVESPERKNVYDGVVQLDEDGAAWVALPEWFEALNEHFRYQLTAVGGPAPNLHVAEEIYENNRFKIAGGEGGMKVCWQVTGSRKDPWAAANPFVVEEDKPQEERGHYLQPDLYDAPEEQSVMRARMEEWKLPQMMSQELQQPPQPPQFPQPPGFEPPQAPETPPSFVFGMQEEHRRQIDDLRGQIEELRRGRLEDEQRREMDDLRSQIEDLRRRL